MNWKFWRRRWLKRRMHDRLAALEKECSLAHAKLVMLERRQVNFTNNLPTARQVADEIDLSSLADSFSIHDVAEEIEVDTDEIAEQVKDDLDLPDFETWQDDIIAEVRRRLGRG
jgi:hypothetical protein